MQGREVLVAARGESTEVLAMARAGAGRYRRPSFDGARPAGPDTAPLFAKGIFQSPA